VVSDRDAGHDSKAVGACLGWLGRLGKPGQRAAETSALTDLPRCAAAWAVVIASAAAVATVGTGPAVAATVRREVQFTCSSSLYGSTSMTALIQANAPDSVSVGEAVPGVSFKVTATVGPNVTAALGLVGATSVKGTAKATGVVAAPQGDTSVNLPVNISDARVPASGPMTVDAAGITPRFVFTRPGTAKISLVSVTARMTPVKSDGTAPVGTVEGTCVLNPGQNSALEITVTSAGVDATPTTPTQQSPEPPPGTHSASAKPTAPTATASGANGTTSAIEATSAKPTAPTATASGTDGTTWATEATSARPTARHSGTAGLSPSASSSAAPLLAAFGALVACGGAVGTFLWLRRRPGRGGEHGG
jgi:Family of unknown function (DUF6801)